MITRSFLNEPVGDREHTPRSRCTCALDGMCLEHSYFLDDPGDAYRAPPAIRHEHAWSPIPLHMGRYVCSAGSPPCGATGYRNAQGKIVSHKNKMRIPGELTARGKRTTSERVGLSPLEDFEPPKERA